MASTAAFIPSTPVGTRSLSRPVPHRHLNARRHRRTGTSLSKMLARAAAAPQSVAIAGAGIGGLSTALALVRRAGVPPECVHVYEPRDALDGGLGAAVNLNGGAAILMGQYGIPLRDVSIHLERVRARAAPSGRRLFDVDVRHAVAASGDVANDLWIAGHGRDPSHRDVAIMATMRADLQRLLADAVEKAGVRIRRGPECAVRDVLFEDGAGRGDGAGQRQRARLVLAGGDVTDAYDLVVGADGVRSRIRSAVVGAAGASAGAVADATVSKDTGFRVIWAMRPKANESGILPRGELHQWFGDGAYALHYAAGAVGNVTEMIALSFRDAGSAASENVEYEKGLRKDARKVFGRRLELSGMPLQIWEVYEACDTFIETGVYAHAPTKRWYRDGVCVLVGDAAHAMAPYLGQGANQAIQDAHALALAVEGIGERHDGMGDALREYEQVRKAPTDAIVKGSSAMGYLETQSGPVGMFVRNNVLATAGVFGLAEKAFITACIPRVQ